MSVCTVRRALLLIFGGKAQAVEQLAQIVCSVSAEFPVPSVVRLGRYVSAPRRRVVLSKRNVFRRDNYECQYCGTTGGKMTIDHVVPRKCGGQATWENLVCACVTCNNRKGEQRPEQVGMHLRARPRRPNSISFIRNHVGVSEHPWKPYLFLD